MREQRVLDRGAVVRHSSRVVYRKLAGDEGGVVLHLDTAAYHSVNEFGATLWSLMEPARTLDELLAEVRALVDPPLPPDWEAQVQGFVVDLQQRGLVEVQTTESP